MDNSPNTNDLSQQPQNLGIFANQQEAKYYSLFNAVDEGFCIFQLLYDQEGNAVDWIYTEANPAFERQTGYLNPIGKRISEFQPNLERSWFEGFAQVARTGEPGRFVAYTAAMGIGYDVYALPVGPAGDNRVSLLFTDIAERKHHERQQEFLLNLSDTLRAEPNADAVANRALRMLSDQLKLDLCYIAVYHLDDDWAEFTHQVEKNRKMPMPAGARISDFSEVYRVATGGTVVLHDIATDQGLSDTDRNHLATYGYNAIVAATLRKGEGRPHWVLVACSESTRRWTPTEVALVEETAERTWAAVERARAEAALREANQRKDEFLAMLGHELRNPLAAISNTLLVLELTQGQDDSLPYAKGIQIINRRSQHLNRMVDDLLDMSRIRQGMVRLQKGAVNLAQLLQLTVEAAQPLFRDGHRHLSLALPSQSIYVSGDETRLSQVVMNLLTNGAKYTDPEGQVWVSLEQVEDQAIIRVRDTGIGLTNEQRTSIFEVFVQGATSLDRPHGGLGLGLAVVKHLVEAHEGQIQALSPGLGQGSEFVIRLPILFDLADTVPDNQPDELPTSGRVLVVDDNVDFADTTARLLRTKGFEVYARYTGAQGLAGAESLQPNALLLDIGMPYLDGYEVCRQIRAQPWGKSIAIIALTGYGLETDKQKATQAGFDGHLLKPVDPRTMAQVVAGAIHRKQSH